MSAPSQTKQTGASFIVSLQQANGSWLLNDQLAGVVSKSGTDPGFSEGGSENLKKGVWTADPEAVGICIIKHQNHTL